MSQKFAQKTILITGGSTGIGLAAAQGFLREGAKKVFVTGRSGESLDAAVALLGPRAEKFQGDVARPDDLQKLKSAVEAGGDPLDVIFANAGVAEYNALGATTEAEFDKIFGINVKGLFFTVQTLAPLLRDEGAIVLTASIVAHKGMANLSLYNASKAAVRSFARSFANDLRARKIRVNAISPGVTETPILDKGLGFTEEQKQAFKTYVAEAAPLARFAAPEEIAAAVLFLASSDASYVTGAELSVDGGLTQI